MSDYDDDERVTIVAPLPLTEDVTALVDSAVGHALSLFTCCEVRTTVVPCAGLFCSFHADDDVGHGWVIHLAVEHADDCIAATIAQTKQAGEKGLN